MRRVLQVLSRVFFVVGLVFAWSSPASAQQVTVTSAEDFYFTITQETTFSVRTYAQQYGVDSMLWLYGPDGNLVSENDDYYGLDSFISVLIVGNGTYRLRAGVCCGNPDAWHGGSYVIETETAVVQSTTTTAPSTTTTEAPTTTIETTTTSTTEVTTSTSTEAPTTTTTTLPPTTEPFVTTSTSTTTTTSSTTSSTLAPTTTSTSTTSTTVPTTTTSTSSTTSTTTTSTFPIVAATSTTTTVGLPSSTTSSSTSTTLPIDEPAPDEQPVGTLPEEPTADEVVAYLESIEPSSLETLTEDQITTLVDVIASTDLTDEQAEEIAQALSEAPLEVKEQFEAAVNVFGGQFDSYVPAGSTVPVRTRRALVAATAVTFAMPAAPTTTKTRRIK